MSLRSRLVAALVALCAVPAVGLAGPIVALDPGHGGADSGAVGVLPPGTDTGLTPRTNGAGDTLIYEKDINLDVAKRLKAYLTARGYTIVMTRTQDLAGGDVPYTTESKDLIDRVAVAEAANAQIFVSLHENSLGATTEGTETYHYLYSSENSKILAKLIQDNLVEALGRTDRGVRSANFYVLRATSMPAVLVEGMFLSNPEEALLLADPTIRQTLAVAVGEGIVTYFDEGYGTEPAPVVAPAKPRYQVNVGAYRNLRRARAQLVRVRGAGFKAAVLSHYSRRYGRSMFFVVAQRYRYLEHAKALRTRLRQSRLPASIGPVPAKWRVIHRRR